MYDIRITGVPPVLLDKLRSRVVKWNKKHPGSVTFEWRREDDLAAARAKHPSSRSVSSSDLDNPSHGS